MPSKSSVRRILIVEDHHLLRIHAQLALEDAGYQVTEASDAAEALAEFAADPNFDAIFTDVMMPGDIDGLALAHRLRDAAPGLPIVVTSGAGVVTNEALPAGGHFVAKPYSPAQLADALSQAMD